MTLVNTPELVYPGKFPHLGTNTAYNLVSTTTKVAIMFKTNFTDTCTGITFRTGTVTTGCTVSVRVETVDGTGYPTGTLVATDTEGTVVIDDAEDSAWKNCTFTASASLVAGTTYAIVIAYSSGAVPNLNFNTYGPDVSSGGTGAMPFSIPYFGTYSGSWSYSQTHFYLQGTLHFGANYYYVKGFIPYYAGSSNYSTGTTPDELGLLFQLPFSAKISGFYCAADGDATFDVVLYDSDGTTALATYQVTDVDFPPTTLARTFTGYFSTPITISKNTNYRIVVKPSSGSSLPISYGTMSAAGWVGATEYTSATYGQYTQRTDAGAWSETDTKVPFFSLIISAVDNGLNASVSYG